MLGPIFTLPKRHPVAKEIRDLHGAEAAQYLTDLLELAQDIGYFELTIKEVCSTCGLNKQKASRLFNDLKIAYEKSWQFIQENLQENYNKVSTKLEESWKKVGTLGVQNPHGSTRACARAVEEEEEYKNTSSSIPPQKESEAFKTFMTFYPKGRDRKEACIEWNAKNLDSWLDVILDSLNSYKNSSEWEKEGGRFVPRAVKFIQDELWTYPAPPPALKLVPQQKKHHAQVLMEATKIQNTWEKGLFYYTKDLRIDNHNQIWPKVGGPMIDITEFAPVYEEEVANG